MHIYLYTHILIFTLFLYEHTHILRCTFTDIHTFLDAHLPIYTYSYLRIYLYTHILICTYTYINIFLYAHIPIYTYSYIHHIPIY